MNIGDTVTTVNSLGTIVGVATNGLPIVEWASKEYMTYAPEELIVVELPEPNDELNPMSEEEEEAYQKWLLAKREEKTESFVKMVEEKIEENNKEKGTE